MATKLGHPPSVPLEVPGWQRGSAACWSNTRVWRTPRSQRSWWSPERARRRRRDGLLGAPWNGYNSTTNYMYLLVMATAAIETGYRNSWLSPWKMVTDHHDQSSNSIIIINHHNKSSWLGIMINHHPNSPSWLSITSVISHYNESSQLIHNHSPKFILIKQHNQSS